MVDNRENFYKDIIDNSNSVILKTDNTGNILFANKKALEIFKYDINELLNTTCYSNIFVHNISENEINNIINDFSLNKSQAHECLLYCITKNNKQKLLSFSFQRISNKEDNFIEMIIIGNIVPDVPFELDAKKEKKNLDEVIVEFSPIGIIIEDFDSRIVDCNPTIEKIIGYKKEELLKIDFSDIIKEASIDSYKSFQRDLKEKGFSTTELQLIKRDNNILTVEAYAKSMFINNKEFAFIMLINITSKRKVITEFEQLIKELEKTSSDLEILNEISKQISIVNDSDTVFNRIADYIESKYGFNGFGLELITPDKKHYKIEKYRLPEKYKQYESDYIGIIMPLDKSGGRVAYCIVNNEMSYFTDIKSDNIKNEFSRNVVHQLDIRTVLIIPISIDDKAIGCLGLRSHGKSIHLKQDDIKSISRFVNQIAVLIQKSIMYNELEKKSNELEEALTKAEEANKLKSEFLAMMSHELRSPLTSMIGFSELLCIDDTLNSTQKRYSKVIFESGYKLLKILSDLLELSVIEAGQTKIKNKSFNIREMIEDLYILLQDRFESKQIEFHKNFNDITDIYSDPLRLRQILFNLIGNAVKFTEKGTINFYIEKINNKYYFEISDTGIGISKEYTKLIFDMFRQVETTYIRKFGGTGLGLAICKKLIEALNGRIGVKSIETKGSSFYFYIPVINHVDEKIDEEKPNKKSVDMKKNLKVLFAEDEETNFNFIVELLELNDIAHKGYKSGKELLSELVINKDYNVILMDIQMYEMSGIECLEEIKKINIDIPVIALTAYAMREDREKYLELGFSEYISKPINLEEFYQKINDVAN